MTIRFLTSWGIYKLGDTATLSAAEETSLVAQNVATTNLTDGTPYAAPLANPAKNILFAAVLTSAEFALLEASGQADTNTWYNVDGTLKYYNGSAWVNVGGDSLSTFLGRRARAIFIGNSLVDSFSGFSDSAGDWPENSHAFYAMALSGVLDFSNRLTHAPNDSLFYDRYGNIGHGGVQLNTITADITTGSNVLAQMAIDNFPQLDLVINSALVENDIGTGAISFETGVTRLRQHYETVETVFGNPKQLFCTPWASVYYDTAAKKLVADQLRAYMRDEMPRIYPNAFGVDVSRLYCGDDWVPYAGLTDGIHPANTTVDVGVKVGRAIAQKLRQLFGGPANLGRRVVSSNPGLTGSVAVSGVATGTAPTNCGFSGTAPSGGSVVSLAEQPGWLITYTNTDGASRKDMPEFTMSGIVPPVLTEINTYTNFEIISGAEHIAYFDIRTRIYYTDGANDFKITQSVGSTHLTGSWQNGDQFDFVEPKQLGTTSKTIATIVRHVKVWMNPNAGGVAQIRVKGLGCV